MNLDKVFSIAGALVAVAAVFVVVSNPNSKGVITGFGDAFAGSIRAAQGR